MSPSGGRITTVEPSMMWSPENSMRSCSSRKQRWFDAWPGVWRARSTNSVASMLSPSPSGSVDLEAVAGVEGEHLGAGALLEAGDAREVVDVGVGADDPPDAVAAAAGDGVEVRRHRRGRGRSRRSRRCRRGRCWCRARSSGPGLLATMRRTSGLSALATPCTMGRGCGGSASTAGSVMPEPRVRRPGAIVGRRAARRWWRTGRCLGGTRIVGPIIGKSPASCRARASSGRTHSLPISSASSWA